MAVRVIRAPLLKAVVVIVAAILGASCAASEPPPSSPLDDTATGTAPAGTAAPLPTFTPAPAETSTAGTAIPADQEQITGAAIDALAEWIGVPATQVTLVSIEPTDWPSACLGVQMPGFGCAQVITPGYRIYLGLASQPTPPYELHSDASGNVVWAPHFDSRRTIENVDASTGIVTLEGLAGSDEMGTRHRVVPGTFLDAPLSALTPGDEVDIAVTYALPDDDAALAVWIVPAG